MLEGIDNGFQRGGIHEFELLIGRIYSRSLFKILVNDISLNSMLY